MKGAWNIFNDKKLDIAPPQQYLSFQDLKLLPEFRLALMREDKETFERILFENGLDVEKGYNINHCLHRSRISNKINDCFRAEASERVDREWLNTPCASLDAHVYSSSDISLRRELSGMNPSSSLLASECDAKVKDTYFISLNEDDIEIEDDEEEETILECKK